jgi:hypothetical protein
LRWFAGPCLAGRSWLVSDVFMALRTCYATAMKKTSLREKSLGAVNRGASVRRFGRSQHADGEGDRPSGTENDVNAYHLGTKMDIHG